MLRLWSGKQDWKEVPTQTHYHTRAQEHKKEKLFKDNMRPRNLSNNCN